MKKFSIKKGIVSVLSLLGISCVGVGIGLTSTQKAVAATAEVSDFSVIGASVRTGAPDGLRFVAQVSADAYASYGENAKYGVIFVPQDKATDGLTVAYSDGVYTTNNSYAVAVERGEWWTDELCEENEIATGYYTYSSAIVADKTDLTATFPEELYNTPIQATGFVITEGGETVYTEEMVRSIGYVATMESLKNTYVENQVVERVVAGTEINLNVGYNNRLKYNDSATPALTIGGLDASASSLVSVSYASDDKEVLQMVDGQAKAISNGTATVTATISMQDGKTLTKSEEVTVYGAPDVTPYYECGYEGWTSTGDLTAGVGATGSITTDSAEVITDGYSMKLVSNEAGEAAPWNIMAYSNLADVTGGTRYLLRLKLRISAPTSVTDGEVRFRLLEGDSATEIEGLVIDVNTHTAKLQSDTETLCVYDESTGVYTLAVYMTADADGKLFHLTTVGGGSWTLIIDDLSYSIVTADVVEEQTPAENEAVYTDDKVKYATDSALTVYVDFTNSSLKETFVNGEKTEEITQTANGLNIPKTVVAGMRYGINNVSFTDQTGKEHTFIVAKDIKKGEFFYYDFDNVGGGYVNHNSGVVSTEVKEGLFGKSLHVNSTSAGQWFGLYKNGEMGFPQFNFVADTEYLLSFDYKIQSGTGANWWAPIRFGDKGDVAYIGTRTDLMDTKGYRIPDTNTLHTAATVTTNADGSLHFTAVFRTTADTINLDFPSWDDSVDIVVDNILVEKLNPNITRVACVGDSITQATRSNITYPEALQMMLGYDEYFVYNFGKSGSNVIEAGELPYRINGKEEYEYLLTWQPDIIVMQLGTNDGRFASGIDVYGDQAYIDGYNSLINEFRTLTNNIYINISPYAFGENIFAISAPLVNERVVNVTGYIAYEQGLPIIDVHSATMGLDREAYFPDYIHGSNLGYNEIAKTVYKGLTQGESVNKYVLKYYLDLEATQSNPNYEAATALYNDANATNEQIDAMIALLEGDEG